MLRIELGEETWAVSFDGVIICRCETLEECEDFIADVEFVKRGGLWL